MSSLGPDTSSENASVASKKPESTVVYPEPLVIGPALQHEKTFIILHGRGDWGDHFGPQFLIWQIQKDQDIRDAFPTAKFVFPTAAKRRAQAYNRSMSHQWFDNFSPLTVEDQRTHETWQLEGLRETSLFLHELLRHEISIIGANNVILGGLSQGCAASMIAMLLWDGPPLRAMFGMCGWLPLREYLERIAKPTAGGEEGEHSTVVFDRADGLPEHGLDTCSEALQALRIELDFPIRSSTPAKLYQQIPMFLGHGILDHKVPIALGREAARCLRSLGCTVETKEYAGLGHWYSDNMLADIVRFLISVVADQATEEVS